MLSFGKTFKIFVLTLLLFIGSSLALVARPQIWQNSLAQTELPTDWPSVYFHNGTAYGEEPFIVDVGDMITIALVVSNLTDNYVPDPDAPLVKRPLGNLFGFDVQFSWNATILKYVNHTVTTPWDDYTDPVLPSPYAGLLHKPLFELAHVVDEKDAIPNSEPGTMAWFGYSSMIGAEVFNGNGTFFTMTFNVTNRGSSALKLTGVALSDNTGAGLLYHQFDAVIEAGKPPRADFTFWPDVGVVNKSVTFDASASYSPAGVSISKYIWDFGDGNVTTVGTSIVSHSYNESGTYTVSLTVEDSDGIRSSPKTEQLGIVEKRNVKIKMVLLSANRTLVNRTVGIEVVVENDGHTDENCTLAAYYNASAADWIKIDEIDVTLSVAKVETKHFVWNTTGVPQVEAYYYVLVNVSLVPYEQNTKDNNMTSSDTVFITATVTHDVCVENLEFGWSEDFKVPVLDGEKITFQITVWNKGTENETAIDVTLYSNGSVLRKWTESLQYGQDVELIYIESLDIGYYNITALAIIEDDTSPHDNRKEGLLQVIKTPKLNFTYEPKNPYVNQTVSFNASTSLHGQPGASITKFTWSITNPEGTVEEFNGLNITYQFAEEGAWPVTLDVEDSYNIKYDRFRLHTSAYRLEARIDVESPPGFPIEYVLLLVLVVIVAVLAIFVYLRRRAKA